MIQSDKPEREGPDRDLPASDRRKKYEKPAFVREQLFETMALACGKISATSGPCKLVKKNS
jgi:hypothetical protein